jgi:hypothetical protein
MTTTEKPREKSLRELKASTNTLYAKNNTDTLVTLNTPDGKHVVKLEPRKGRINPSGSGSIQAIDSAVLDMMGTQKLIVKKKISISDSEDMDREIMLLMADEAGIDEARQAEIEAMIMPSATENAIVPKMNDDGTFDLSSILSDDEKA